MVEQCTEILIMYCDQPTEEDNIDNLQDSSRPSLWSFDLTATTINLSLSV